MARRVKAESIGALPEQAGSAQNELPWALQGGVPEIKDILICLRIFD